jgi:hypothetical protein
VDVNPRVIEGTKETKSLYVIHVEMAEKNIDPSSCRFDLHSEAANSSASVQHQYGAVSPAHLHGGRITSVAVRLGSWRRYRATGAKEGNPHHSDTSQNKAAAPRNSA